MFANVVSSDYAYLMTYVKFATFNLGWYVKNQESSEIMKSIWGYLLLLLMLVIE
jgi:hypothetical protein